TRAQKETEFGLTDLWDPAKRTRLCASCHVGSSEEGKVLTHAMYAAGHPPLPAFEVAAFSSQMPPHWQPLAEQKPTVQELLGFAPDAVAFEGSRLALAGSIAARESYLRLLTGQASQHLLSSAEALDWALFDCFACHHDLKTPSWRQERGYP